MRHCAVLCAIAALAAAPAVGRRDLQGRGRRRLQQAAHLARLHHGVRAEDALAVRCRSRSSISRPIACARPSWRPATGAPRDRALRPARLQPPGQQVGGADAGRRPDHHRAGARGRHRSAQGGRQFRLPRHDDARRQGISRLSQRREAGGCGRRHGRAAAASHDLHRPEARACRRSISLPAKRPSSEVVFKATYEYPEKLDIEDHPDAPLVKMR